MTFNEWMETVPQEFKGDPLWRMEVYRLGLLCRGPGMAAM